MPEAWAAELDRRFNEACRAAQKRYERRQLAKQSAERLPTLVPEIEALAENPNYNDVRSQWYALRKQWQAIARDVDIDAELEEPLRCGVTEARSAGADASATRKASSRWTTCIGCRRWCRSSRPAPPPKASRSSRPIS